MDVDDEDTNQSALAAAAAAAAVVRGKKHSFFQRSESTLCLGCPPPDPFQTPMHEALPLADQPQLLQPNAREDTIQSKMFSCFESPTLEYTCCNTDLQPDKKDFVILHYTFVQDVFLVGEIVLRCATHSSPHQKDVFHKGVV